MAESSDRDLRIALLAERDRTEERLAALRRNFDAFVEGAEYVNTDDEHDPEGATIAFERAQVISLRDETAVALAAIDQALADLDAGTYGRCTTCGGPIGTERLLALPGVTTCVGCAR